MNKKIILHSRPQGEIQDSDFKIILEPLNAILKQGEVLVRVEWLSIDPGQSVWVSGGRSYILPVPLNGVVKGLGVGYVITSKSPAFKKGNYVSGLLGWQEFSTISASELSKLPSYENPQLYIGVLGITGLTAYFAITEIAKPQKKDIMVVSTAAGAVGSVACQIGKMKGCKVIGICGSDEKCEWLMNVVKIDGVVNYKKEKKLSYALRKLCPEGIDIFIDHVGGKILDAVLANIRKNAKIVLCGAISSYGHRRAVPVHNYP